VQFTQALQHYQASIFPMVLVNRLHTGQLLPDRLVECRLVRVLHHGDSSRIFHIFTFRVFVPSYYLRCGNGTVYGAGGSSSCGVLTLRQQ
jgi:hypothetical protein